MESKPRRKKRGKQPSGYEPLGARGVLGIESLPGGGLVSGKSDEFLEDLFDITQLKADSYTKPELREKLKQRIMAGSRGGKPGQWSARKAQLLALEYERAGGGYRGGKRKRQRSLDKWTDEEWTTSDGKPAIRDGGTTRYLPKKAWEKLTPGQRSATNQKKRRGSRSGEQFVANTERARVAGSEVRNAKTDGVLYGRAKPRVGDPDVFDNIDAARLRARQLGCIGVARRLTPDGVVVWTPCTNVSDYRRRTGVGEQAQRDRRRAENDLIRRVRKKDADLFGSDAVDIDIETKGVRRTLGNAAKPKKRKLRPVAFDRNAEDADGDGLVQEGTTQERPSTLKKPAGGTSRLGRRLLVAAFNQPDSDGSDEETKPSDATEELQPDVEDIAEVLEPKISKAEQFAKLFEERAERISKTFGPVETATEAKDALAKAFPNATINFKLPDKLGGGERGFIHTLLDLSITHPNTAKSLDRVGVADDPKEIAVLKKMKGDAAFAVSVATIKNNDGLQLFERFERSIITPTELGPLTSKGASSTRQKLKDKILTPHSVLDFMLRGDDEKFSNDQLREMYATHIAAHEFGHAFHEASLMPSRDLDFDNDPVGALATYYASTKITMQSYYTKAEAEIKDVHPNISDDELKKATTFWLAMNFTEQTKKLAESDPTIKFTGMRPWLRDGLDWSDYLAVGQTHKDVSAYGQTLPVEAVAETFAFEYMSGFSQESLLRRSSTMDKMRDRMDERKAAGDKNALSDPARVDEMFERMLKTNIEDLSKILDITCPDFNSQ